MTGVSSLSDWRRLPLATAIATYLLIVMGAVVRATGSGLGCPDWPTCQGSWVPPLEREALIEYAHRSLAVGVGVLVLAMAWSAWRRRPSEPQRWWLTVLVLVLVAVQAAFGRQVVLAGLDPGLVTVHLGVALVLLALLVVLALPEAAPLRSGRWRKGYLWLLPTGVLTVALLGAAVRSGNATLAFSDWPLMGGQLVPGGLGDEARRLQFVHRLTAGIFLAGTVAWAFMARRTARPVAGLGATLAVLVTAQAGVGAYLVLGALPTIAVIGHLALGSAAWVVALLIPAAAAGRG